MIHRSLIVALCLAGCSAENSNSNSANAASAFIGLNEWNNRDQIADLVGVDPIITEWCAAFVNYILDNNGIPGSESVSQYPLLARSFLDWGETVEQPVIGDIVVFPRGNQGWQGHVGFYIMSQEKNGIEYYYILGGNQRDDMVSLDLFPADHALGIRRSLF